MHHEGVARFFFAHMIIYSADLALISTTSGPKELGQADHSLLNVYSWIEEHKYEFAYAPTQLLSAPEDKWRARGLEMPHAMDLAESFVQTGKPPTHIHAACLVPPQENGFVQ